MKSRVEELLLQLEQIDYQNSPNLSVSNQPKHDSAKEQESFKQGLNSLSSSPGLQDDSLKTELQDLKTQLKILSIQKKKEKINLQKQCSNIDKKVLAHKEELAKIEKQLESLEDKAENFEKIIKEKQDEKLEAFKFALKPLEDTYNTILEEKEFLKKKKEDLSNRANEILLKRASKTDELKSLLAQRAEYFSNREKLQSLLSEIKEKEPHSFKEYLQEIETKEILSAIKARKSKQTTELKEIEKKLAEIEGLIEKTSEQHQKTEVPERMEKGIEDLEKNLNMLCEDLKVQTLSEFTKDQLKKKNYFIEQIILKEQLSLIDQKTRELEEDWKKEKENMERKISEMRRATEEQEVEYAILSSDITNSQLENALESMKSALKTMSIEAEKAHRIHKSKISALVQWKTSNQSTLLIDEAIKVPDDSETIKMFKREIQKNVPKLDQWKNIESVINLYIAKIQERNNNYHEIKLKESQEIENNQEKKLFLAELRANKANLLAMRDSLHKEFLKIITLEKAAMKKFENAKIASEIERKKQIDKKIEENMSTKRIVHNIY